MVTENALPETSLFWHLSRFSTVQVMTVEISMRTSSLKAWIDIIWYARRFDYIRLISDAHIKIVKIPNKYKVEEHWGPKIPQKVVPNTAAVIYAWDTKSLFFLIIQTLANSKFTKMSLQIIFMSTPKYWASDTLGDETSNSIGIDPVVYIGTRLIMWNTRRAFRLHKIHQWRSHQNS